MGVMRVSHFMNQLKINYLSELMVEKPNSQAVQVMEEQERTTPGQGLIGEVRELCEEYGLPDASREYLDPEWVKKEIGWRGMFEVWTEARDSPKIPLHLEFNKSRKYYFDRPKMEAKMLFYYYVGEINFRTNRRREAEAKFGGVQCLVGTCCGLDNLAHIAYECHGYQTKAPSNMREEDLSQYLMELHRERIRRWNAPLIMTDVTSLIT